MPAKNILGKKQVLFIHSAGSQGPYEGSTELLSFLKAELGNEYEILFPLMPYPDNPSYIEWMMKLEMELDRLNDGSILIGHSLGGSVILKYLTENNYKKSIAGLFLIAAPFWGKKDWEAEEYTLQEDFSLKLPLIENIFIYHSTDDPVVPVSHLTYYAEMLPQAVIRKLNGIRHSFGTGLPELVEDIKSLRYQKLSIN